jgi:hypothetical protein
MGMGEQNRDVIPGEPLPSAGFFLFTVFYQDAQLLIEKLAIEGLAFPSSQFPHRLGPPFDLIFIHPPREFECGGPFSPGKGKDVKIRERQGFNQAIRVIELLFRLSWKSYDHICPDREV